MRPKKKVLLYHADPDEGSRMQFVLEIRFPITIQVVSDVAEVERIVLEQEESLLVVLWLSENDQISDRMKEIGMTNVYYVRVLAVYPDKNSTNHAGLAVRVAYANDMEGVTTAMKALLERKRGPKRQFLPVVPAMNEVIEERATA